MSRLLAAAILALALILISSSGYRGSTTLAAFSSPVDSFLAASGPSLDDDEDEIQIEGDRFTCQSGKEKQYKFDQKDLKFKLDGLLVNLTATEAQVTGPDGVPGGNPVTAAVGKTKIKGNPTAGDFVSVEGKVLADGSFAADEIEYECTGSADEVDTTTGVDDPDAEAPPAPPAPPVAPAPTSIPTPADQPQTAALAAGAVIVEMINRVFVPDTITVNVGDTVTWSDVEGKHTTTSYDGLWDSGTIMPGDTFSFTFTNPGTYRYRCTRHDDDGMVGEVIVQGAGGAPPPTATPTPPPQQDTGGGGETPAPLVQAPADGQAGSQPGSQPASQSGVVSEGSSTAAPATGVLSAQTGASQDGMPTGGGEPPLEAGGTPWTAVALSTIAGLALAILGATLLRTGVANRR